MLTKQGHKKYAYDSVLVSFLCNHCLQTSKLDNPIRSKGASNISFECILGHFRVHTVDGMVRIFLQKKTSAQVSIVLNEMKIER